MPHQETMPTKVNRGGITRPKLSLREREILRWAAAVFLAIILDGALRKWVLPSSLRAVPYFAKDVLAGLFLLTHPARTKARWAKHLSPFVLGICICLAPSFLLGLTKAPAGAVTVFKNAVLWPLFGIRMGSYLTKGVTERLWKLALATTIPMAVLASVQYYAGPASILNRYAWDDMTLLGDVAAAGDFVRATGTFSYIVGLASFSLVMFCLFLGRSLSARGTAELWFNISGLGAAVVCGLVTGSRGIEVFMAAVAVIVVIFVPKRNSIRLIGGIVAAGIVSALLWNSSLAQGVIERWNGTENSELSDRLAGTGQPIDEMLVENPLGMGLGLYAGISAANGVSANLPYNETPLNKIATETGILGCMAVLLGMGLIIRAARWTIAARKTYLLPIAVGALMQVGIGLWYDHTSTGLWWWTIALWLGDALASGHAICTVTRPTPQLIPAAVREV
jgi:hypothetical protein